MALVAAVLLPAAAPAQPAAQPTPADKPIRIVVPYASGGGIDVTARVVATALAQQLHQPVIVENRPGANSMIGAAFVAKAPADGYTYLFTSGSTVSVLPHIAPSLPIDPRKDLVPVGEVAKLPFFLVVNKNVPAQNLADFMAMAKRDPGALTYGSAGSGTGSHLGFELLKRDTGIEVTHVPYKATNEALPDLLTGRIASMMADLTTVQRAVKDGALRVLAVTTRERSPFMPSVPTVAEQGVPGYDLELWVGLFAPAATTPSTIERVNAGLRAALQAPAVVSTLANGGWTAEWSSPQQLDATIRRESDRWAELARTGALRVD